MMNTQKGFSSLLGLLFFVAIVGGGLYLYSKRVSEEITEVDSVPVFDQYKTGSEQGISEIEESDIPSDYAGSNSRKLVITGKTESFQDGMLNMGERIRVMGNNFLPGYGLSVYLRPSVNASVGRDYQLIVESVGDTHVDILVPGSGIDGDIYGGYHLVVKGENGEASIPVSIATQPLNKELELMDVKLENAPATYAIGDVVILKYQKDSLYVSSDVFVQLINVDSKQIITYGNIENGLPLKIIDEETMSFAIENASNQGQVIRKGVHDVCVWVLTKGNVGDCSHNSIVIE